MAKRLGYSSRSFICEHLPSECTRVAERYRAYRNDLARKKREQECLFIQEIADLLRSQGKAVTRTAILKLGLKSNSIRNKHIQEKLKEVINK